MRRNGVWFLNLLLLVQRYHVMQHLQHVVATRAAEDVDRMAVLVADSAGRSESASSIRRKTYQKPVIQVKGKDSILRH